ncbi:hypothetical protein DL769_011704 [Monosporascus sp. CRB-8-3]|nr:hypothetical protein DL769_011704 [Monosporascus sp. CRB-8-3]
MGTNVSCRDHWIQELRGGSVDAFVALLMIQLPNLTSLYLGPSFTRKSHLIPKVLKSMLLPHSGDDGQSDCRLHTFEQLQDVSVLYYDPDRSIINNPRNKYIRNTDDILPLFYLPSVRHISASVLNPVPFEWPTPRPPEPARLVSLDLTQIREGNLGRVLSVANRLKTLRWECFYRPDLENDVVKPVINLDQIASDISRCESTLADLTISALSTTSDGPELPTLYTKGSLKPMRNFAYLRKLEAPIALLAGSFTYGGAQRLEDVLSRNIEVLTITDDLCLQWEFALGDTEWMALFRPWLRNWKTFTPRLQRFNLLLKDMDDEWYPPMRDELRELCAQVDVQVDITKLEPDIGYRG